MVLNCKRNRKVEECLDVNRSILFVTISPDARYGSEIVTKLINVVMWRGKKNAARTIVYDAIDVLSRKLVEIKRKVLISF